MVFSANMFPVNCAMTMKLNSSQRSLELGTSRYSDFKLSNKACDVSDNIDVMVDFPAWIVHHKDYYDYPVTRNHLFMKSLCNVGIGWRKLSSCFWFLGVDKS